MKTAGRKRNIPMYCAGILLCLTLLSLHMVFGLFARYVSAGTAGDSARTAAFYLEAEGDLLHGIQTEVIPGDTQEETLLIINKSEVRMKYTLTVHKETGNLPLELLLKNNDTSEVYSFQNGTVTVEATLAPANQTDHYTLEIRWLGNDDVNDPNLAYMGMLDYLTVTVSATQID